MANMTQAQIQRYNEIDRKLENMSEDISNLTNQVRKLKAAHPERTVKITQLNELKRQFDALYEEQQQLV